MIYLAAAMALQITGKLLVGQTKQSEAAQVLGKARLFASLRMAAPEGWGGKTADRSGTY